MYLVQVIDWGDDAYRQYGESKVIAEFEVNEYSGLSYDGGRLDIGGYPDTIWVAGHQWSVEVEKL